MIKRIKTEILIEATPEKVWSILSNFNNYPHWNPFIKSVKGEVKVGNKITVKMASLRTKGTVFKPNVLTFEVNKELCWSGRFLVEGLFDGEHQFILIDNLNGTTTFIQSETFRGSMVPLFSKKLMSDTQKGFEAMNLKLKDLVEKTK